MMMTFLGFCMAATGASLFLIKGEGFSAATTVVFYGFAGSVVGLVVTVLLSRGLSEDGFRRAFRIVLALTLIAIGVLVYRVVTMQRNQTAEAISGPDAPIRFTAFTEKELPTGLAKPTLQAIQELRRSSAPPRSSAFRRFASEMKMATPRQIL